jgi:WD40 repeat protein
MNAKTLIDETAKADPNLIRLAETVSFAVVIDRPLLRAARLKIPEADVSLEADLWLSELTHTRSPQGLTFHPEVAAVLRERLRASAVRMKEAWNLTQRLHAHLDETLKIEEKIGYLSANMSASAAAEIEVLLKSVLAAMVDGGRDALAHWTARALENFPTSVRNLETAQMLDAGARLRLGADVGAHDQDMPEWMSLVAPSNLPRTAIGVRLLSDGIELDASPDLRGDVLELPSTRPLLLEVSWTSEGTESAQQVALQPGEQFKVETRAEEIELRTITGERYKLRRSGSAPPSVARFILSFDDVLARHSRLIGRNDVILQIQSIVYRPDRDAIRKSGQNVRQRFAELARERSAEMRAAVKDMATDASNDLRERISAQAPGDVVVITGPVGRGKTALLAEMVRRFSGDTVCIAHFFQSGIPRFSYFDSASRSIIAQLIARFDLPPWTISMRLPDVFSEFQAWITEPVVLVLDDVDRVNRFSSPEDVLEQFSSLPGQVTIVASSTTNVESVPGREVIELRPPSKEEAVEYSNRVNPGNEEYGELEFQLRETHRWLKYDRLLRTLAVARAPVFAADVFRLAKSLSLKWQDDAVPHLERRLHGGVDSIAFVNDWVRANVVRDAGTVDESSRHNDLAMAVAPLDPHAERSWYGLLHGPYHWTRAGRSWRETALDVRLMQRRIEEFGAAVTLDALEDAAAQATRKDPDVGRILESLRAEVPRLEQSPADAPAIVYSAIQRAIPDADNFPGLDANLVPLRLRKFERGSGIHALLPASVSGMHCIPAEPILLRLDGPDVAVVGANGVRLLLAGGGAPITASGVTLPTVIAGDRDGAICFWDVREQRLLGRHAAHEDAVIGVSIGNNRAISCSADSTIAFWRRFTEEGSANWRFGNRIHVPDAITVATEIAGAGVSLAIGCRDGSVCSNDETFRILGRFHDGPVKVIAAREPLIVTAGHDGMLRLYDQRYGTLFDPIASGHDLGIAGMALSRDGGLLATWSTDRTARIWATKDLWNADAEPIAVITGHLDVITTAAWSHDGKLLLTASADGEIRASVAATAKLRWRHLHHTRAVRAITVSEKNLAYSAGDDRLVRSCNTRTGQDLTPMRSAVTTCTYMKTSSRIVVVSDDRLRSRALDSENWMTAAGGRVVITNDKIVVIHEQARATRFELVMVSPNFASRSAYSFDPAATLAALAADDHGIVAVGTVEGTLFVTKRRSFVPYRQQDSSITALAVVGERVLAGTLSGSLTLVDRDATTKLGEHSSRVTAISTHESGASAVSGALDGSVLVTNLHMGESWRVTGHAGAVVQCGFSGFGVLTASDDGTLAIRTLTGDRIAVCEGHRDRITSFAFRNRRNVIYTASLDGTIRAWTFEGRPRGVFYGTTGFTAIAATPFGAVAGDDAGNVWLIQDGDFEYVAPTTPRRFKKTPVRKQVTSSRRPSRSSSKKSSSSRRIK